MLREFSQEMKKGAAVTGLLQVEWVFQGEGGDRPSGMDVSLFSGGCKQFGAG